MRKVFRLFLKLFLWFLLLTNLWVLAYKFINVPGTPLMAIRSFEDQQDRELLHDWVDIEEISTQLQMAVICAEDQNFVRHNGFDVEAIKKAREDNKKGKRLRGASTISQQTAKNVFLWPGRTWIRKGFEVYFTFLIEIYWSKERILEVYLNSIEFGPHVYGAEAASQYWFKRSAAKLSKDQAAALAAILPNPRMYRPVGVTSFIAGRKDWIKKQMSNYGPLELDPDKIKPLDSK